MSQSYAKAKAASKEVLVKGPALEARILSTLGTIAKAVGSTLGPGGQPVLIERQEHDMPPIITKDGVSVFRALGFNNSVAQVILESARDAASRTADSAGDGTTTATILSEAIVRIAYKFCRENPRVSPQRVTRRLMAAFSDVIEPMLSLGTESSIVKPADLSTEEGRTRLWSVAKVSANGDTSLADKVLEAYDLVGDNGNITIVEVSGPSGYEVERIEGYPVTGMGYEESCGRYASKFLNDPGNQRVVLEKPLFVLYNGKLTEIQTITFLMEKIGAAWQDAERKETFRHNVILVANGFSESVTAQLALNFSEMTTINVLPLLSPLTPIPGSQLAFLEDLAAFTGAKIFDPLSNPLDQGELEHLGTHAKAIEMNRYRTTIFSEDGEIQDEIDESGNPILGDTPNMFNILDRVSTLSKQAAQSPSLLDKSYLEERIGKLTGGIARLKVVGNSAGELRERRDRAEDAILALRGAMQHGCLPGGGWGLLNVVRALRAKQDDILDAVLCTALYAPIECLFSNAGFHKEETEDVIASLEKTLDTARIYDVLNQEMVDDAFKAGILDSTPAVREAIRNSLSIASSLGTCGCVIAFGRDLEVDRQEARDNASWLRDSNSFDVNDKAY